MKTVISFFLIPSTFINGHSSIKKEVYLFPALPKLFFSISIDLQNFSFIPCVVVHSYYSF